MYSSASSSSSCVVTPGFTCSPSSCSVSTTTRPARSICSISAVLLRMMAIDLLQTLLNLTVYRLDGLLCMDPDDVAMARAVVLDQRLGLVVVEREAAPDGLGRVVRAFLLVGALQNPLQERVVVGNEVAPVVHALELSPERRVRLLHRADDVSRRDVRNLVVGRDPLGLRPLPGPLRPEQQHFHVISRSLRRSAASSATPSAAWCRGRRRRRSAPTCPRVRARSPARSRSSE